MFKSRTTFFPSQRFKRSFLAQIKQHFLILFAMYFSQATNQLSYRPGLSADPDCQEKIPFN